MFERAKWQRVRTDAGWHLRLMGGNGEPVLTSEVYEDKRQVVETLKLVRSSVFTDAFATEPQEVDERVQSTELSED